MNTSPRKSKRIVNKYLSGTSKVQFGTTEEIAKNLRHVHRAGSVEVMTSCLNGALNEGRRLSLHSVDGESFLETKKDRTHRQEVERQLARSERAHESMLSSDRSAVGA